MPRPRHAALPGRIPVVAPFAVDRYVHDLTGDTDDSDHESTDDMHMDTAFDTVMFGCDDLFPPAVEINDAGEEVFRVERIIGKRTSAMGGGVRELQYLVKWFGYPHTEASWEPTAQMDRCEEAIERFEMEEEDEEL